MGINYEPPLYHHHSRQPYIIIHDAFGEGREGELHTKMALPMGGSYRPTDHTEGGAGQGRAQPRGEKGPNRTQGPDPVCSGTRPGGIGYKEAS